MLFRSKGKVQVGSYSSLSALESWKNSVNSEGGNISVSTTEDWNSADKGTLVSHSNANSSVNPGTTITALISRGPSVTVKNYVSENSRDQDGLTESFEEVNNSAAAGTVIGQSISAGQVVARGTSIKITISKGPVLVERKTVPPASSFLSDREITSVGDAEGYIRSGMSLNGFNNVSFSHTTVACSYIGQVKGQTPGAFTDRKSVV